MILYYRIWKNNENRKMNVELVVSKRKKKEKTYKTVPSFSMLFEIFFLNVFSNATLLCLLFWKSPF